MASKTPQFDKELEDYFGKLPLDKNGGLAKTCRFSSQKFYVRPEDIQFYKKIRVPLPTLHPEERRRRRLASYNSYGLFKNTSLHSKKKIISIYPSVSPIPVFEHQVWYSDKWDAMKYAKEYDPTKPFFGQFYDLQLSVPHPNLLSDPTNINSDYTNSSKHLKNCYYTFDQNEGEDLYYHEGGSKNKNCIDCWAIDGSDTCYDSMMSDHLFKSFYSGNSKQCTESYFLWDSRNCDHCFMSSSLRNKKYVFRNEYIGKEEYEKQMKTINFGSYAEIQKLKKEFTRLKENAPRRPTKNERAINSFGDYIINSKNVYFGMYVAGSENIAYSEGLYDSSETYDVFGSTGSELCYEMVAIWGEDNYECKFSLLLDNCEEVEYSEHCRNCSNCFGCVGLDNKSFCIFNKQYTQKEYWTKVDEIKAHMLEVGDYGEFFPPHYLPFPYRITFVGHYPGFDDYKNAERYGYNIAQVEDISDKVEGDVVLAENLPDDIKEVGNDILKKVIYDSKNKKHFRIIKQELAFYRKHGIPLPREHPSVRMAKWRKDYDLIVRYYKRKCAKCAKQIETTYEPERPEKNIWCEECYLKFIG